MFSCACVTYKDCLIWDLNKASLKVENTHFLYQEVCEEFIQVINCLIVFTMMPLRALQYSLWGKLDTGLFRFQFFSGQIFINFM